MDIVYSISQRKKNVGILTWYLRTSTGGKVKYKSLKTTVKKEAQAVLDQLNAKRFNLNIEGSGNVEMQRLIEEWVKHIHYEFGKNSQTSMTYVSRIKHFQEYCNENRIIFYSDLTPIEIESFVQSLQPKSGKTVLEIIKTAKMCCIWGIDNYNLPSANKFKRIKPPKTRQGRVEFWEMADVEKILANAPNAAFKAFWAVMAYAGLRYFEARNLTAENIHDGVIAIINGKGGKDADIPISPKLEAILGALGIENGPLFTEIPRRNETALNELRIAVRLAKIEGGEISHHKFRHSFASELLRNGENPKAVQELMRHSGSIEVLFRHYAHTNRSDLKAAVEKL